MAGHAEKGTPPQAAERGGAGKRVGGLGFRGPVRPVTNSMGNGMVMWATASTGT